MKWYLKCVKENYLNFKGRARRKEYWMFFLINSLIAFTLGFVIGVFEGLPIAGIFRLLSFVYSLALFLPGIAVTVRRLHDTNRSAWWILLLIIPLLGPIVILVFLCLNSTPTENNYCMNPKLNDVEA